MPIVEDLGKTKYCPNCGQKIRLEVMKQMDSCVIKMYSGLYVKKY